ncbi:MAG: hypothetical protein FJ308_10980 [Planctomycetes bacterium]|nr:hypothetical protein [Planctomycetota bacterium]
MKRLQGTVIGLGMLLSSCDGFMNSVRVAADDTFEQPPIRYSASESKDPVALLKNRIESGQVILRKEKDFGYLRDVLRELNVLPESQVLVFSKTSFQIHKISPTNPRAIYFNDSVYVGYVPGSDTIELAANDPSLGAVFYTLDGGEVDPSIGESAAEVAGIAGPNQRLSATAFERRNAAQNARLVRDRGQCLSCHATSRTENVPGYLVRSVYPDRSGRPRTGSSSYATDYRSSFAQRWGGWYVTGTHGNLRHMGNAFAIDRDDPQKLDTEAGANLTKLPERVPQGVHLVPQSDLVALMVLEHQVRLHNLITKANYEARQAITLDATMNQALGRDPEYRTESTRRRIHTAANALADGLFFRNEPLLESEVSGNSRFAEIFSSLQPRAEQNESLRELDLKTRLFRYPLSYMIYTPEFRELPHEILTLVQSQLLGEFNADDAQQSIDEGETASRSAVRWSQSQREAIRRILEQTAPWILEGT